MNLRALFFLTQPCAKDGTIRMCCHLYTQAQRILNFPSGGSWTWMRLSVNQNGDRQDDPATVHQINVLTVVASESYKEFVKGLQKDIRDTLSERPRKATIDYFVGKEITTEQGKLIIDTATANLIYKYLIKNDYTDNDDHLTNNTARLKRRIDSLMPGSLNPISN